MSINGYIDKEDVICYMYGVLLSYEKGRTFKSYLLVNSKFKLLFATLMNLEGIMTSEISLIEKENTL